MAANAHSELGIDGRIASRTARGHGTALQVADSARSASPLAPRPSAATVKSGIAKRSNRLATDGGESASVGIGPRAYLEISKDGGVVT